MRVPKMFCRGFEPLLLVSCYNSPRFHRQCPRRYGEFLPAGWKLVAIDELFRSEFVEETVFVAVQVLIGMSDRYFEMLSERQLCSSFA